MTTFVVMERSILQSIRDQSRIVAALLLAPIGFIFSSKVLHSHGEEHCSFDHQCDGRVLPCAESDCEGVFFSELRHLHCAICEYLFEPAEEPNCSVTVLFEGLTIPLLSEDIPFPYTGFLSSFSSRAPPKEIGLLQG